MRLVGCVRVSRVAGREGDSFISPAQQRDRIVAHANSGGHRVIEIFEDLDQPGTRMDRPGLERALQMVERGEADGIAVAKLDRFARSVSGAAKTLERLEAAGGILIAADLGMDTSTPAGKLMRNVLIALGEFEVDRIRENWQDAGSRAIARGVHTSNVPPIGYQRGAGGRLIPDPVMAPLIRELYIRRGRGEPWKQLAAWLDEQAPRDGGGAWPWQTLAACVKRRTYLGEAFNGDKVNREAHEPLVDIDTWERAQPTGSARPRRGGDALLAGLLRCAGCSTIMSSSTGGTRGYGFYECRRRHSGGICPEPAKISKPRAHSYVLEHFLPFAADSAARDSQLTVDTERANTTVEQAEAELVAYRDGNLISILGDQAYREGLELRARRLDDARVERDQLRREHETDLLGTLDVPAVWDTLTVDQQRQLIAAAIDVVFVKRAHLRGRAPVENRLHICWAGQAPADLPGRKITALRPFAFPNDRPRAIREPLT